MKNILITGGRGSLAKHLQQLIPEGIFIAHCDYDLTIQNDVEKMFFEHKPDIIINCAARVAGIMENMNNQYDFYIKNILMNTLIIDTAQRHNVKRFINISSTCAYPDVVENYPMTEEQIYIGPPSKFNESYAVAKRAAMQQIEFCNTQFGTQYQNLIPCNLYSENEGFDLEKSHFVSALIKKIHLAKINGDDKIILFGNGGFVLRQFMYANDLANVIKRCVDEDITESFNVAPNENLSILEITKIALKACDAERLEIGFDCTKPDGQYRKDVSNAKMMSIFPDFKFTPLEDGIRDVYQKAIELGKF